MTIGVRLQQAVEHAVQVHVWTVAARAEYFENCDDATSSDFASLDTYVTFPAYDATTHTLTIQTFVDNTNKRNEGFMIFAQAQGGRTTFTAGIIYTPQLFDSAWKEGNQAVNNRPDLVTQAGQEHTFTVALPASIPGPFTYNWTNPDHFITRFDVYGDVPPDMSGNEKHGHKRTEQLPKYLPPDGPEKELNKHVYIFTQEGTETVQVTVNGITLTATYNVIVPYPKPIGISNKWPWNGYIHYIDGGRYYFAFGDPRPNSGDAGMSFDARAEGEDQKYWSFAWVQMINSQTDKFSSTDPSESWNWTWHKVLDTTYPYHEDVTTEDSPFKPQTSWARGTGEYSADYTMWLMAKPSGGGEYIPVQKAGWKFSFRYDVAYGTMNGDFVPNAIFQDAWNDFPDWDKKYPWDKDTSPL